MLIYKNATIVTKDQMVNGYIRLDERGYLIEIKEGATEEDGIDCQDLFIIPSFIDTHTHGGYGMSFDHFNLSPTFLAQHHKYLEGLITEGVGAYVPTNVSLSLDQLNQIIDELKVYLAQPQAQDKPYMCA